MDKDEIILKKKVLKIIKNLKERGERRLKLLPITLLACFVLTVML